MISMYNMNSSIDKKKLLSLQLNEMLMAVKDEHNYFNHNDLIVP